MRKTKQSYNSNTQAYTMLYGMLAFIPIVFYTSRSNLSGALFIVSLLFVPCIFVFVILRRNYFEVSATGLVIVRKRKRSRYSWEEVAHIYVGHHRYDKRVILFELKVEYPKGIRLVLPYSREAKCFIERYSSVAVSGCYD